MELHLVIMSRGCEKKELTPEEAMQYVTGYSLAVIAETRRIGDTSEPEVKHQGTCFGFVTGFPAEHLGVNAFCPFGPVLVTPQLLPDPGELSVTVTVNDVVTEVRAEGSNLLQIQEYVLISSSRTGI